MPDNVTLPEALSTVRHFIEQGRPEVARDVLSQLQRQTKGEDLLRVTRCLVALERRQGDAARARAALIHLLERTVIAARAGPPGERPVLLMYGLASVKHLRFHDSLEEAEKLTFSFNAGHFDANTLLRDVPFGIRSCFVSPAMDEALIRRAIGESAIVLNTMADPAMEAGALELAANLLRQTSCPVINDPLRVLGTIREAIAGRLRNVEGLVVPRVTRAPAKADALAARLAESRSGVLIRPLASQTGIGMVRVTTARELGEAVRRFTGRKEELYITDYHPFEDARGLFCKMRVFRIGDALYPEHCIVSDAWNVHSADRHRLMRADPALQAAEQRFIAAPAGVLGGKAWEALEKATALPGLDYVGIDFAQLPDGRLLLFECNPAMRVNFDHVTHFPYLRPALERLAKAFTRLLQHRRRPEP